MDGSIAWMLAAAAAFGARELPFHLVELGATGGLNLAGDWLEHDVRFTGEWIPPAGWKRRPHRVLSRTGLEAGPGGAKPLPGCEPAPRFVRGTLADAPRWLTAAFAPKGRQGLLVFNALATGDLDEHAYSELRRGMAEVLARWGDRAIWVEYDAELRIHTAGGTRVVASSTERPGVMRLHVNLTYCVGQTRTR